MDNIIFVVILIYVHLVCFSQADNFQSVPLLNVINNVVTDLKIRNEKQCITLNQGCKKPRFKKEKQPGRVPTTTHGCKKRSPGG